MSDDSGSITMSDDSGSSSGHDDEDTDEALERIKEMFRDADLDKDGFISREELEIILRKVGEFEPEDLELLLGESDQNGDGKLSYEEFIDNCLNTWMDQKRVMLQTPEDTRERFFEGSDIISEYIRDEFQLPEITKDLRVSVGSEELDLSKSFDENGVHHGATLSVLWTPLRYTTRAEFEAVVADIAALNPDIDAKKLGQFARFDQDGHLQEWDLRNRGSRGFIRELPESFGSISVGPAVKGELNLSGNQLESLPKSFGFVIVGGELDLSLNMLRSLPESFASLQTVGGSLLLQNNRLEGLPTDFGVIKIHGDLSLENNQLSSLPDSFCSIFVHGWLRLGNNRLESLPEDFGSVRVTNGVQLHHNMLQSLPESIGSLKLGSKFSAAGLWLHNNQLRSLPDSFGSIVLGDAEEATLNLATNQLQSLPESFGSFRGWPGKIVLWGNPVADCPDEYTRQIITGLNVLLDCPVRSDPSEDCCCADDYDDVD